MTKDYQKDEENKRFEENGKTIYLMLKSLYPEKTAEDLNLILYSILSSLIILMRENVEYDNHKNYIQLVYTLLNKNTDYE